MQDAFLRFVGKNAIYLVARGQNRRGAAILSAEMREKGGAMFSPGRHKKPGTGSIDTGTKENQSGPEKETGGKRHARKCEYGFSASKDRPDEESEFLSSEK